MSTATAPEPGQRTDDAVIRTEFGAPTEEPRRRTAHRLSPRVAAMTLTGAVMLVIGSIGLDRHSMWGDEAVTSYAAHLPLPSLFHLLQHLDAVHGCYYLVMHVVVHVGGGEVLLRLPSVVGMALAVALTTAVGARLSRSIEVGAVAGLVLSVLPAASQYAQDARSYGLVTAGAVGSSLLFLRAVDRPRELRPWLFYGVVLVGTGYLNEISLLIVLAHGGTLLLHHSPRLTKVRWAVTAAVSGLLVAPLVYLSSRQTVAINQFSAPSVSQLGALYREFFGPSALVCLVTIGCAVVAMVPGATPGGTWANRDRITVPMFATPLLVIPPVVLFVESRVHQPLFIDRYVFYSIAGAVLLVADGAVRIGRTVAARAPRVRALPWAPALVVVAVALLVQLPRQHTIRTPAGWSGDYGAAARYVHAHARRGDGVEFISRNFRNDELGYPADFRTVTDLALARTPRASGTLRGIYLSRPAIRTAMLAYRRIWVVGLTRHTYTGVDRYELSVLAKHFHVVRGASYHGVRVQLYQR